MKGKAKRALTTKIWLPKKLVDSANAIFEARGTSLETFMTVTLTAFLKVKKPLALHHLMTFGKFEGIRVEDAVRTNPEYFEWLIGEGSGGKFSPEVIALVEQFTDDQIEIEF